MNYKKQNSKNHSLGFHKSIKLSLSEPKFLKSISRFYEIWADNFDDWQTRGRLEKSYASLVIEKPISGYILETRTFHIVWYWKLGLLRMPFWVATFFLTKQIGIFWNDKANKDVTNVIRYCLHYTLKASDDVLYSETAWFDWIRCYQSWSTIIHKILRKIISKHISLPRVKTEIRKFYWWTNQNIHRNYRNK